MFFNGRHGLSFVAHHCGECKNSTVVCKSVYCSPYQYDCFFLYTAPFPLKGISCWFSSNNIAPSNVSLTLDDSPIILMALCRVLSVISSTHSSNVFPFLFQQLSEEVIDIFSFIDIGGWWVANANTALQVLIRHKYNGVFICIFGNFLK